jgi:site-specific DNA recombinase
VHGIVDSLYLKDLAKRTFRGVEQLALNGLHTGGRVFGYRRVPIESQTKHDSHGRPAIHGVRLEVDPDQAATAQRIFERYAAGHSMKRVAMDLNGEGIPSPQPQKGKISQSWCPSSIRHILYNERYRGVVIWGKTYKLRSQKTGKRIYRRKLESEWVRTPIPSQRIISDEFWNAVRGRMQIVQKLYGTDGKARPRGGRPAGSPYLFTGLLKCSVCRGSITIVSGQWKSRDDSRYDCSMHAYRGNTVCRNNLLIGRRTLEEQLLAGLQAKVLHPDVIEYTLWRFEEELARAVIHQSDGSGVLQRRQAVIQKQIRNCTEAIASGQRAPSIMAKIADLEQESEELNGKLANSRPETVRLQLRDTRRFVESRLKDLRGLLDGEPQTVRAEIAKHVQKIALTPDGKTYIASGSWNLLGGVAVTMVPGARIELATPAFSGRRSTNELPRQIRTFQF